MILTRALINKLPSRLPLSRPVACAIFTVALGLAAASAANAATINYGDFNAPGGIMFQQVIESSGTDPVPLYGPPTPFAVGLDFDPTAFVASATSGGADITDGQLNFTVMGAPGVGIGSINLFERGDYTLVGTGTIATKALAGAIINATITQINGLPVAPISVPASNASVGFNLVANAGIVQPWSLGTGLVFNLPPGQFATKVEIAIDNSLVAISEAGSVAFIAKKDFRIDIMPRVPEPTSLVLTGLASMVGLAWRRSRN